VVFGLAKKRDLEEMAEKIIKAINDQTEAIKAALNSSQPGEAENPGVEDPIEHALTQKVIQAKTPEAQAIALENLRRYQRSKLYRQAALLSRRRRSAAEKREIQQQPEAADEDQKEALNLAKEVWAVVGKIPGLGGRIDNLVRKLTGMGVDEILQNPEKLSSLRVQQPPPEEKKPPPQPEIDITKPIPLS
jgi:hypothetical protein